VLSNVKQATSSLDRGVRYDEALAPVSKTLSDAASILDDAIRELERYVDRLDADPARLAEIDDRVALLRQLMRKHGDSIFVVLARLSEMKTELARLDDSEVLLAEIDVEMAKAFAACELIASRLTASRKKAGQIFSKLVRQEIKDLGMPGAIFEVQVDAISQQEKTIGPTGADVVTISFSANPGEPAFSLEKVASGGELSRVLLGIKRVLLTKDLTLVSIFDEVDAGVGGAMGEAIGEKLQAIALGRQVLCVTHLAQIAARAAAHIWVEKKVAGNRTISVIRALDDEQRVEELARMLGGRTLTETTRRHAREFLQRAQGVSP